MIKSHPTPELLREFVAGDLPPALALAVSAHVDMCRLCQKQVRELEAEMANQALTEASEALDASLESMLIGILQQPAIEDKPAMELASHIQLQERSFWLPRALRKSAAKAGGWSQMGQLWRSRLIQDESWRTSFLYIEKGGRIPCHTHKGREATLVLSGRFMDEDDLYSEGDFVLRDANSHSHTPGADEQQDCLCFTAVEAPLHFTSGAARLLNPLGKLLY